MVVKVSESEQKSNSTQKTLSSKAIVITKTHNSESIFTLLKIA